MTPVLPCPDCPCTLGDLCRHDCETCDMYAEHQEGMEELRGYPERWLGRQG